MRFSVNRISSKLLLVCLSFSLPITVMLNLMVKAKQKDIDFALWEGKGNEYQRPLEKIFEQISLHRWLALRSENGDASAGPRKVEVEARVAQLLGDLTQVDAKQGEDLQFTAEGLGKRSRQEFTVKGLQSKWQMLLDQPPKGFSEAETTYKALINHVRTMITHAGDTSNLILDPDLDSYYLMDVTLLALPQLQDRLQDIAAFVEKIHQQGTMARDERVRVSVLASFLKEADLDRVGASSQTSLNEDQNFYGVSPSLQENLKRGNAEHTAAVQPVVDMLNKLATLDDPKALDIGEFRRVLENAMTQAFAYHALAFDELDTLLRVRIASFDEDVRQAITWTTLSLMISAALAFVVAASLIRRVKRFNATTKRIADGDLAARVNMASGDEIGELARSFDTMTDRIGALNQEVERKNNELKGINQNLERLVAERTATIKTILDNVKFGFLLVDNHLRVEEGFSKSCAELLGHGLKAGADFLTAVGVADTRNGPLVREFLQQAFDDLLPEEMTLQQMPPRVQIGERILSIMASAVRGDDGKVARILFTLIDATNLERVERENHRHKVLVRLLKELDAFRDFIEETKTRIALCRRFLGNGEQAKIRAELHTIKGNTSAYDMIDIAKLVHHIEDGDRVDGADIDRIEAAFVAFLEENFDVLQLSWNGDADDQVTVSRGDIEHLIKSVRGSMETDGRAVEELTKWAQSVQYKTARSLVGALPDYGERLASRLGKSVKIRVEGGDVRMDPEIMRPIMQSLVHLVRNAIDHGVEAPHMRQSKPEEGLVTIECSESAKGWTVKVSDDGHGIDAERVAAKAVESGLLPAAKAAKMSQNEKYRLVFLSGVSTADSVSDISGRGVGMSAVDAVVQEAGGRLEVTSVAGKGTTFLIEVPKDRVKLMPMAA